jgi:hypothetical protein
LPVAHTDHLRLSRKTSLESITWMTWPLGALLLGCTRRQRDAAVAASFCTVPTAAAERTGKVHRDRGCLKELGNRLGDRVGATCLRPRAPPRTHQHLLAVAAEATAAAAIRHPASSCSMQQLGRCGCKHLLLTLHLPSLEYPSAVPHSSDASY